MTIRTRKLDTMPYAQAQVEFDGYTFILRSYNTIVLELDLDGWLKCNGLYSATTRKHISAFMREYTKHDYYFAKKAYEGGYIINIHTGEVKQYA